MFVAAIFASSTFSELKKASSYETWVKTTATIVECSNERQGVFPAAIGHDTQTVTCQFTSAGRVMRKFFHSQGWKYHKGQTIAMRFDPFAPEHSMVDPSTTGPVALWGAIAFAVFFIAGTGLLIYALKRLRAQSARP
jgi:hypothetical protein